jgi:hypothetical protein
MQKKNYKKFNETFFWDPNIGSFFKILGKYAKNLSKNLTV